jgi:hypothetical protein
VDVVDFISIARYYQPFPSVGLPPFLQGHCCAGLGKQQTFAISSIAHLT